MIEIYDLIKRYDLKEIVIREDIYMRSIVITFYDNKNKCINRCVPIEQLQIINSPYFSELFKEMGRRLKHETDF